MLPGHVCSQRIYQHVPCSIGFVSQPFKLGDRVGVAYSSAAPSLAGGAQGAWFEGVCEKVDLRCVM